MTAIKPNAVNKLPLNEISRDDFQPKSYWHALHTSGPSPFDCVAARFAIPMFAENSNTHFFNSLSQFPNVSHSRRF